MIEIDMDARLLRCANEAHARMNEQLGVRLSFPSFLEVCINEYLSRETPDLHRVAFGKAAVEVWHDR